MLSSPQLRAAAIVHVTVPFLTDRNAQSTGAAAGYYGSEHAPLSAGYCDTQIDSRGPLRLGAVSGVRTADPEQLVNDMSTDPAKPLVIYVHGFGEDFVTACKRASLLQHRLQLEGRLLLFTWPSSGNLLDYWGDIARMERSVATLETVLAATKRNRSATQLNVIAHSLGTRAVMTLLERVARQQPAPVTPVFGELILIASDISRDDFVSGVGALRPMVSSLVIYVSENDRVLRLSHWVNLKPRLGHGLSAEAMAQTGTELTQIDLSGTARANFGGHVYHIFNDAAVEDLRARLQRGSTSDAEASQNHHRSAISAQR